MGYRDIVEAEDGGQAWATLGSTKIDLLLTDWNMPVMNGLELLTTVRHQPGYEHLPVLLFTGRNTKDDVVNAARSGASGYLIKPFTAQQFMGKVRELIGKDLRGQPFEKEQVSLPQYASHLPGDHRTDDLATPRPRRRAGACSAGRRSVP